jgi:hypothetical protein
MMSMNGAQQKLDSSDLESAASGIDNQQAVSAPVWNSRHGPFKSIVPPSDVWGLVMAGNTSLVLRKHDVRAYMLRLC